MQPRVVLFFIFRLNVSSRLYIFVLQSMNFDTSGDLLL